MTEQEAIRRIKEHNSIHFKKENGRCPYITEALNIAISALEKQIQKKPNTETINRGIDVSGEYDIDSNYICPSCKSVVGDYESKDIWYKHCPECGQAIKNVEVEK